MFVSPRGPLFQTARSFSQRLLQHPYCVPRNTRGNLPVYTDIRNGGTRYLVLICNVGGNADVRHVFIFSSTVHLTPFQQLARDLTESLFVRDSPEWQSMYIEVI
jgi:large subunit ribosomal protein L49